MAEFPALPLFTDAYLSDTRHLSAAQHGAYLLLLMTAWRMPDCALPDDDDTLARWACMDRRTWERNKPVVMAFWTRSEDAKWRQGRLLDERKYVADKSNKNSGAAKARWLKNKKPDHANALPDRCQPDAPTPTPTPTPKPLKGYDPPFEKFWSAYPKNGASKSESFKAWQKAIGSADPETITNALPNFVRYLAASDTPTAHATTWLNQQRWTIDYAALCRGRQQPVTATERDKQARQGALTL
jgi:uncharacterized protein YdaU (DUF1376 family)